MKTYTVKQIAEILNTNPETVRRWIRDEKLKAVQLSRKGGNIVTEAELKRFIKATPKYLSKISVGASIATLFSTTGIGVLAGGIVLGIMEYYEEKNKGNTLISVEELKVFLQKNIVKLNKKADQKRELIQDLETELGEISKRIKQYNYLLKNEEVLFDVLKAVNSKRSEV